MIEVLVAVMIIGLVATAALKLGALSAQALGDVRAKEIFLDRVRAIQTGCLTGELLASGVSMDLSWKMEDREKASLDPETFGQLDFENKNAGRVSITWRELTVTGPSQTVTLIMPPEDQESKIKKQ